MFRPLALLSAASLALLSIACSSTSARSESADVQYEDGPAPEGIDPIFPKRRENGPRVVCEAGASKTGGRTYAADLGKRCSGGSNKLVCAVTDSACSSGSCLVDRSKSPMAAYCTIACDSSDADSCPSGWQCVAQDCSKGPSYVCQAKSASSLQKSVATSDPFGMGDDTDADGCVRIANGNDRLTAYFQAKGGTEYAIVSLSTRKLGAYVRSSGGSWQLALASSKYALDSQLVFHGAVQAKDAAYLAIGSFILRLDGTDVEEEWDGKNAAVQNVVAMFVDASGVPAAITDDGKSSTLLTRRNGSWSLGKTLPHSVRSAQPLAAGGFVGACGPLDAEQDTEKAALCVSEGDGTLEIVKGAKAQVVRRPIHFGSARGWQVRG